MKTESVKNKITIESEIKKGDVVMVIKGNEKNKNDWQYGQRFKVKKIEKEVYGVFAFKNKIENIDINRIISIKTVSK